MKKSNNQLPVNRCFKSQLFVMLFEDKKELLELYNAVTGKNYQDPEELTINTLENAIYMSMKNDFGYLLRDHPGRKFVWNPPDSHSNSSVCCFL